MSDCVTYKKNIPNFGVFHGKPFKFSKTSAGNGKYAYAGFVEEYNGDKFTIMHDATVNIVVFRNNEDNIYLRFNVEETKGIQEMNRI